MIIGVVPILYIFVLLPTLKIANNLFCVDGRIYCQKFFFRMVIVNDMLTITNALHEQIQVSFDLFIGALLLFVVPVYIIAPLNECTQFKIGKGQHFL